MNSIRLTIFGVALFLLVSSPAVAQPLAQDNEVTFAGGFFHTQHSDAGSLNIDGSYGYFLDPQMEAGLRVNYSGTFNDNDRDAWLITTAPFFDFHFRKISERDSLIPFVGGFVGGAWNDQDGDGVIGPEGGIKVFFSSNTFMAARYRYEWYFNNLDVGTDSSDGNHVVTIGFGYVWGGEGNRRFPNS
jgi:hypothetical protein